MKINDTAVFGIVAIAAMIAVAARGQEIMNTPKAKPMPDSIADAKGDLHVPKHYRDTYQLLGIWTVAADDGPGAKQLHIVYASPGAIDAYRKDGHFSDGAVLVKEVYEGETAPMTTGTVSHESVLKGWFVMVKDSAGRYPGNKLWGDGWGWSWFDADKPTKTTSTDYKADCLTCHVPARSSDWVYVGGYPPLRP